MWTLQSPGSFLAGSIGNGLYLYPTPQPKKKAQTSSHPRPVHHTDHNITKPIPSHVSTFFNPRPKPTTQSNQPRENEKKVTMYCFPVALSTAKA